MGFRNQFFAVCKGILFNNNAKKTTVRPSKVVRSIKKYKATVNYLDLEKHYTSERESCCLAVTFATCSILPSP